MTTVAIYSTNAHHASEEAVPLEEAQALAPHVDLEGGGGVGDRELEGRVPGGVLLLHHHLRPAETHRL